MQRFVVILLFVISVMTGHADKGVLIPDYEKAVEPFLKANCLECHGPQKTKGEVRVDQLPAHIGDEYAAEAWQEVLDALNLGEMPPKKEPRPPTEKMAEMIEAVTNGLFLARQHLADKRRVTLRRLNRREYENTIHDLLGVRLLGHDYPEDGRIDGFDTAGEAQFTSEGHFQQYRKIGRKALDLALIQAPKPQLLSNRVEGEQPGNKAVGKYVNRMEKQLADAETKLKMKSLHSKERSNYKDRSYFEARATDANRDLAICRAYFAEPATKTGMPLNLDDRIFQGGGHDYVWATIPQPKRKKGEKKPWPIRLGDPIGHYTFRCRIALTSPPKDGKPVFVDLLRTDNFSQQSTYREYLGVFEVTGTMANPQVIEVPFYNPGTRSDHLAVRLSQRSEPFARNKGAYRKRQRNMWAKGQYLPDIKAEPFVWVDWVEVKGPIIDQWPPIAQQRILFNGLPSDGRNEGTYAKEIIRRFAKRAFREQQASPEYLAKLFEIYVTYRKSGSSFLDAIKEPLSVILASPSFIYFQEANPSDKTGMQLTGFELANRLSYFLWSHPPDAELLRLAKSGALHQRSTLQKQVERMIKNPKSEAFFTAFIEQWLELDWLDMIVIDQGTYRDFDETLRRSFRQEPIEYFRQLVLKNRPATELIDGKYVVIDAVLGDFYGLQASPKFGFAPVNLPANSPRGGLLGQAAVLTMGGTGERTSPVERGVFIYERLLGREVPPPPPNVPQLTIPKDQSLTVRQTLAKHTETAQCASCHRRMDPLGFGLEHFNAIGQWRDEQRGSVINKKGKQQKGMVPIDARGVMPDGRRRFADHDELKAHLMHDANAMTKGLIKSLMTYALGRRVGHSDLARIDQIQGAWKKTGYGMRELVHRIVQTDEFQQK